MAPQLCWRCWLVSPPPLIGPFKGLNKYNQRFSLTFYRGTFSWTTSSRRNNYVFSTNKIGFYVDLYVYTQIMRSIWVWTEVKISRHSFFYNNKIGGIKHQLFAFPRGPCGFRRLREACRSHFHLSWYLSDAVVTNHGPKPCGDLFYRLRYHLSFVCFNVLCLWDPKLFHGFRVRLQII